MYPKEPNSARFWPIQRNSEETCFGFATAFRFDTSQNLSLVARGLEEGVTVCAPKFIAGREHIRRILNQASEYWSRDEKLARNKSIDLLMRITCQSQIATAVSVSGVADAQQVALFGLVGNPESVKGSCSILRSQGGTQDGYLLKMDSKRKLFLKEFHALPQSCTDAQIIDLLVEKSVLLSFSK